MGKLVKLVEGLWSKSSNGEWSFEETTFLNQEPVVINKGDTYEGLVELIRIRLNLGILTPVALTYQLPAWMIVPDGPKTPPITLLTDKDVEIMISVTDYMPEALLYVTSGPELVAKYQFFCRSSFTVEGKLYLGEGVTEDQHRQAILDLVDGHPIVCSKHILGIMYNEPQLLIIYRVALEIEKVYDMPHDDDDSEAQPQDPRLTMDAIISLEESFPISPDDPSNYDPNDDVLYEEPMNVEQLQLTLPNFHEKTMIHQSAPLEVEPISIWRDMTAEEAYWNGIMNEEDSYVDYGGVAPHPTEGVLSLPLPLNRRISAPQPAITIIIDDDDDDISNTGSSDSINESENMTTAPPPIDMEAIGSELSKKADLVLEGESSVRVEDEVIPPSSEFFIASTPAENTSNAEPCLDLKLGFANEKTNSRNVPMDAINDSCSDGEDGSGGFGTIF